MTVRDRIKQYIERHNPIAINRRNKMRDALHNRDITFLTPNCLGGILFHDLGLQFLSPTINTMMSQKDFFEFVLHLNDYLKSELVFYEDINFLCPCAKLHPKDRREIVIHFTHYKTRELAAEKWYSRITRMNPENLFVFLMEKDGLSKAEIAQLKNIKVRGLVVFTAHKYDDIPFTVYIKKYAKAGQIGNILRRRYIDDRREYEKYFDFVSWFNNAEGGAYNVRPFCK